MKSTLNFQHFEKKMTFIGLVFPKLRTAKDVVGKMFKTPGFRKPFENQHAKTSETLLKSA